MKLTAKLLDEISDWVQANGLLDRGGATLKEFCTHFGIGKTTYYRWLQNGTFGNVLTRAREIFCENVENRAARSLLKQVEGYRCKRSTVKNVYEDDGHGTPKLIRQEVVTYETEIPPDTQAIIFLLTKINPGKWGKAEALTETPQFIIEVEDNETADTIKKLVASLQGDNE